MVSDEQYVDWLLRELTRRELDAKERHWIDEYFFKNSTRARRQGNSRLTKPLLVLLGALPGLAILLLWVSKLSEWMEQW